MRRPADVHDEGAVDRSIVHRLLSCADAIESGALREVARRKLASPTAFELPLFVVDGVLTPAYEPEA